MKPILPRDQVLVPRFPMGGAVKHIGLGGVGGPVARFGATFLASLGTDLRYLLIEGDKFEPSNATRMLFSSCGNKAAVLREELLPRFAHTGLSLIAVEEFVTPENIQRLIQEGDFVFLTVDNHATRKLVNDHCAQLAEVSLISGGNDGVGLDSSGRNLRGTYGNVQVYLRRNGQDLTPPLTHFHPEIQSPEDHLPTDLSCTELLASTPQVLFANLTVASAMLNTFWLLLCGALHYSELAFDIADGQMRPITPLR